MDLPRNGEIEDAVILAAGLGSRLIGANPGPKCLAMVQGRTVFHWIARALAAAGVFRLHVVLGHRAELLERALHAESVPLALSTTCCPDWELGNGRSALHARTVVGDQPRFLLLMSDHLVSSEHVRRVTRASGEHPDVSWLATCPVGTVQGDLDDATKVTIDERSCITSIGKELPAYNGIDTGVFLFTQSIFPALEEAAASGEFSLTGGNRVLARRRTLRAVSVAGLIWQDIDTLADLELARRNARHILSEEELPVYDPG